MSTRVSVDDAFRIVVTPEEFELKNSDGTVTKLSGVLIQIFNESGGDLLAVSSLIHSSEKKIKVEFAETRFIKG